MLTSKDMFQIILDDLERDVMFKELSLLLPPSTNINATKYKKLYELKRILKDDSNYLKGI